MPENAPNSAGEKTVTPRPAPSNGVPFQLNRARGPFRPSFKNNPKGRFRGPAKQLPQLAGVVIIKDDTILLLRRSKTGWLEIPGGKVEPGEDSEHAAIREASEEIGVNVRAIRELGKDHFFQNGCKRHYTWYLAEILPGQEPILGEPQKFKQLQYVKISELENAHLHPNMKKFMKRWKKGKLDLGISTETKPATEANVKPAP